MAALLGNVAASVSEAAPSVAAPAAAPKMAPLRLVTPGAVAATAVTGAAAAKLATALDLNGTTEPVNVHVTVPVTATATTSGAPGPKGGSKSKGGHKPKGGRMPRGDHEYVWLVTLIIVGGIAWMSAATLFGTHERGPHFMPPGNVP